jgi:hypothetical protein
MQEPYVPILPLTQDKLADNILPSRAQADTYTAEVIAQCFTITQAIWQYSL